MWRLKSTEPCALSGKGLTLVELLVALALGSFALLIVARLLNIFQRSQNQISNVGIAQEIAESLLTRTSKQLKSRSNLNFSDCEIVNQRCRTIEIFNFTGDPAVAPISKVRYATTCAPRRLGDNLNLGTVCGLTCAINQRPIVTITEWPDQTLLANTVSVLPIGDYTIGAALCLTQFAAGYFRLSVAIHQYISAPAAGGFRTINLNSSFAPETLSTRIQILK